MRSFFSILLVNLFLLSSPASSSLPPPSTKLFWATPLQEYSTLSILTPEALIKSALSAYSDFLTKYTPGPDLPSIGDAFYAWQLTSPIPELTALHSIALEAFTDTSVSLFNKPLTSTQASSIYCWAAVAGGSSRVSYHPPHAHRNSELSLVYYAQTPPGAGSITFYDPRSRFLDNVHVHQPTDNTLIVFPSWLTHAVAPSESTEMRVAFSCNLPGTWDATKDLNLEL